MSDPRPPLLPLSLGARLIALGLDCQAGRIREFSLARRLAEEIFADAFPAESYAQHLTPGGARVAERAADALEIVKFGDPTPDE